MMGCKHTFIFRCDGTQETGLGHVSRCIALAEALQEQGCNSIFFGNYTKAATELLSKAGFAFKDIQLKTGGKIDSSVILKHIREHNVDGIIVDSYFIKNSYLDRFKQQGIPVILIDDFKKLQSYHYSAIINFTVNANNMQYPCKTHTCMLGPEYFLARRGLRSLRTQMKSSDTQSKNILVAMGGMDPENLSEKVVNSLLDIVPHVNVKVVVGNGYKEKVMLSRLVEDFQNESSVVDQQPDLTKLFSWCDVCICAGGLTKYEAAYLGIPALVMSENEEQAEETVYFAKLGLVYDLGLAKNSDKSTRTADISRILHDRERRNKLSQAGLSIFPVDPTNHVAEKLIQVLEMEHRSDH